MFPPTRVVFGPPIKASYGARPEHKWISNGSTLNPSPGQLLKRRRDTAEGCRDRATESLLRSVTIAAAEDRQALEENAARWNARAELLDGEEVAKRSGRIKSGEHGEVRL
jgi:hypothetical protein